MPRSPDRDRLHLLYMLDVAEHSQQFIKDRARDDLHNDRSLQFMLAKAVELIGESANQISNELRVRNSQIPWRKIIGMRHVLVHNYWQVEMDVLWDTVIVDIPLLIDELRRILNDDLS